MKSTDEFITAGDIESYFGRNSLRRLHPAERRHRWSVDLGVCFNESDFANRLQHGDRHLPRFGLHPPLVLFRPG